MKILKLKIKNINSLKGEWEIDFTDPSYSQGTYAIIGPTGSGKTTILDAICLGLYGMTPRFAKTDVTKEQNQNAEVMTRGTGESNVVVTFSNKGITYQSEWLATRAHKKAEGNIQPIKRFIYKIIDNDQKIICDKTNNSKEIAAITGLDFQQFTRSMLLAQGQFSRFFDAKGDERAEILKKITNTEIYEKISQKVYKMKDDANKAKIEVEKSLGNVEILSEEERNKINTEIDYIAKDIAQIETKKHNLEERNNIIKRIAECSRSLDDTQKKIVSLEKEREDFSEKENILCRAEKASRLETHYSILEILRDSVKSKEKETQDTKAGIPYFEKALKESEQVFKEAEHKYEEAKQKCEDSQLTITQVREIENKAQSKLSENKLIESTIEKIEANLRNLSNEKKNLEDSFKTENEKLNKCTLWLNKHLAWSTLNDAVPRWQEKCKILDGKLKDREKTQKELCESTKAISQLEKEISAAKESLNIKEKTLIESSQKADLLDQTISQLLNGCQLADLNTNKELLRDLSHTIEDISKNIQAIDDVQRNRQLATAEYSQAEKLFSETKLKKEDQEALLEVKKKNRDNYLLSRTYDEVRAKLTKGQPCPVCGSEHHPWADSENIKDLSAAEREYDESNRLFEQYKKAYDAAARTYDSQKLKLDHLNNEYKNKEAYLKSTTEDLANQHNNFINFTKLNININNSDSMVTDFNDSLSDLLSEIKQSIGSELNKDLSKITLLCNSSYNKAQDSQQKISSKFNDITNKQSEREIAQKENAKHQTGLQEAKAVYELKKQELAHKNADNEKLNLDNEKLSQDTENTLNELQQILVDAYKDEDVQNSKVSFDNYKSLEQKLINNKDDYNNNKSDSEDAKGKLQNLTTSIEANNNSHSQQNAGLNENKKNLSTIKDELDNLDNERCKLLPREIKVDDFSNDLNQRVKDCQSKLFEKQRVRDTNQSQLKTAIEKLANAEKALQEESSKSQQKEQEFKSLLSKEEFAMEEDFLNARLTHEEIKELQDKKQELNDRKNTLEGEAITTINNKKQLEEQFRTLPKDPDADNKSSEELEEEITILNNKLNNNNKDLGSKQEKIKLDNENIKKYEERASELREKEQELRKWEKLNMLIGSSDGKTYLRIAQNISLDNLIYNANTQLEKITSRYNLIRHNALPILDSKNTKKSDKEKNEPELELDIVDKNMGGEIRSSRNLSGGEKFITSLALALGLASMSNQSNDLNLESLFIDEGFGTLDGDVLGTALNALSNLQIGNGKVSVGIISHREEVKEEVANKIELERANGGYSRIKGPGCTEITNKKTNK